MPNKYKYIAIEGNIGAGKTTLCKALANDWNYELVLEQFTDNPFLPLFYENPERYAFQVELFFMNERHKQLQAHFDNQHIVHQHTIADYFFLKTLLFANKNLIKEEYQLFQQLFTTLNSRFPKPDLLVYLHRPIAALQKLIQQRGRSMEQEIAVSYLEKVETAYLDYIKSTPDFPVVVFNLEDTNFIKDQAVYQQIKAVLEQPPMEHKVHYLTIQ